MKVVQINAGYWYSSIGRTTMELHEALQERGIDSFCACADFWGHRDEKAFYKIGGYLGRKVHALFSRCTGKQAYYSRYATYKLVKWLRGIAPDVIHLRNLHSNYISFPMLMNYIIKNDIKVVITLHDVWAFTGGCCYYTEYDCTKWKCECGNCPAIGKSINSWGYDSTKKVLNDKKELYGKCASNMAVVGVSDWVTQEAKQSILGGASIVKRIYNWIDTEAFYPRKEDGLREKLNIRDEDIMILGVAQNWVEEKGFFAMLDIATLLDDKYKMVLVGNSQEKNIPSNVQIVGAVNNVDELAKYYSAADVFLNLSQRETFGKVAAEAMACGTPCVLNDTVGLRELISEETGMLVKWDNYEEVVSKIKQVCTWNAVDISEKCVQHVKNCFSKDVLIEQYVDVYSMLRQETME